MRAPVLLAATLSLAAGCATNVPNAVNPQRSASTYYCWEHKLVDTGDRLVCNWNADARAACDEEFPSYVERSSVKSEPQHAYRCANGHDLAVVTTR
jgi:hypothetical protein